MNVKHSSESNEHYTPSAIVEAARATMGSIDLDPATSVKANKTVKAAGFYALPINGLNYEWHGNIFCNPPGGSLRENYWDDAETCKYKRETAHEFGTRSHSVAWWIKLMREYQAGRVKQAVFIAFTVELLQLTQGLEGVEAMTDFQVCIPAKRIQFLNENSRVGKAPSHANAIVYVGCYPADFAANFEQFGAIV